MKIINTILWLLLLMVITIYAYPIIENNNNQSINIYSIDTTNMNQCLNDNDNKNNPCPSSIKPTKPSSTTISTPTSSSSSSNSYPIYSSDSMITTQMGVLGGLFIVFGLYLMVLGFRGFRITMFVMGFLLVGLLTWIGLTNCQTSEGYLNDQVTMIAVPAGLGVLGGIVFVLLWNIGIYLTGAIGGLSLGLFILCWKPDLVITSDIARPCFLAGISILFGALCFFIETYIILFATSFIGSFIFIIGIDILARTGYVAGIRSIIDRNRLHHVHYEMNRNVYILLSFTIVLFLMALGWQLLFNRGRDHFGMVYVHQKSIPMENTISKENHSSPSPSSSPPPQDTSEEKKNEKPTSPPPPKEDAPTTSNNNHSK